MPSRTALGFWAIAIAGMVLVLTAVAFLQYRWTMEANRGSELRIGAGLQSLMTEWHADLYREFSAICTAIQVGPDFGARDTWNDYLERYIEWNDALPHDSVPYIYRNPDIVGEIYIWETGQIWEAGHPGTPRMFWLNLNTRKIGQIAPVPELSPLLSRLRVNSASLSMALNAWKLPGKPPDVETNAVTLPTLVAPGGNSVSDWQFDENIPALVHPIFHHTVHQSIDSRSPVDWIIITLDMNVLRKRVLPGLSTRYFGSLDGLDYRVALVRDGAHSETIYSSDPEFSIQQLNTADSVLNIFGDSREGKPFSAARPSLSGLSPGSVDWHHLAAPAWFSVIRYGPARDSWLLLLQRRADPLLSTINRGRRRNLMLGTLVLFVLAVSFGVLTVAGYRSQNFAKLQMQFVASISHELRTPLAVMFSAGENMTDGVIQNNSDLIKYGSIIKSQSRQLMTHVDRILQFASIRSGKDHYTLRPLEIRDILATVRRNLSALIDEAAYTVEETIEPDIPPVMGDIFAVCGCLENLVTNAIKYGGTDRCIYIAASSRTASNGHSEVAISVEDHGIGIAPSELKHIFEPFYRADEVIAAQIHGAGLGLSLARHLTKAIGGRLTVVSQLGVGSTFTMHLQVARANDQPLSSESREAVSASSRLG